MELNLVQQTTVKSDYRSFNWGDLNHEKFEQII